ncbi:MAG: hypothetical protein ACYTFN_15660 [Planctomycetota bacterium]|jgi:YHS domain-containing protein
MFRLLFPYLLFGFLTLVVVFDNVGSRSEVHASTGKGGTITTEQGICAPCGMEVTRDNAIVRPIRGVETCATRFQAEHEHGSTNTTPAAATVARDLVCQMDVDDRITAVVEDVRYHFCTDRCRELFLQNPELYIQETCPVCVVEDDERVAVSPASPALTWQDHTYHFCTEAHRDAFAKDPAGYFMHTMWGIPNWLYAISVGLVLILSFGLFELIARWSRGRPGSPRVNLFRVPGLLTLLRWPPLRFLCQLVFVVLFLLIILAGLFGNQLAARNIAPLLTWTVWWGGLVIVIMFLGKAWCYVCPWDAIAGWIERLRFWGKGKEGLSLGIRWPRTLRNIVLATVLFVGLTWLELGFRITMNPSATAMLGLLMLTLTLVAVLIFERRAFCRYGCLVGRVSGLYALFSATEVRAVDSGVCRSCASKDCYHGNDKGYGCPTGLFPGTLDQNTYCIDCLECVKTCPSKNMVVNARPWGADLATKGRPRKDEAYLALLMLAITGFHGLTMTPAWKEMLGFFEDTLGLAYIPSFSLGMLLLMATPVLIYAVLLKLTVWFSRTPSISYGRAFVAFAYSVLPIALFYHLAHNLEHMLMEGQKVIPLLSNPFGYAPAESWTILGFRGIGEWNLFGTANWTLAPLVSLHTLWFLQVLLVLVGHVYALWVADRTARRLYTGPGTALRSQLPMLVGMVAFSMFSLWLLKQPMEMRTSAM